MAKSSVVVKSQAGRRQESVRTGPSYAMAEYLNRVWDEKVPYTNEEVAQKMGYRAPNIISMWRTGKTKVALERLPEIAAIMHVDMMTLLPLWMEQYLGSPDNKPHQVAALKQVDQAFKRITTVHEWPVIRTLRQVFGRDNPKFSEEQLEAIRQIALSEDFAKFVIKEADREGLMKTVSTTDDANI